MIINNRDDNSRDNNKNHYDNHHYNNLKNNNNNNECQLNCNGEFSPFNTEFIIVSGIFW